MAPNDRNPFARSRRTVFADGPFFGLQREMNKLFDDMFRSFRTGSTTPSASRPRLDVHEADDEFCIVADLPGVAPADVSVRVDGNNVIVSGERRSEAEESQRNYHVMERSRGLMRRLVQLPFSPDPAQVRAHYANGVLTVHIPKKDQAPSGKSVKVDSTEEPGAAIHASGGGEEVKADYFTQPRETSRKPEEGPGTPGGGGV